jgi:NAD(P)-dependent dehydrogenase (short-subunit alcohol dehydrogenase family)
MPSSTLTTSTDDPGGVRPLDDQTILITGSTDGLGLEVAKRLAGQCATLVVHGRHPQRIERALTAIGGTAHADRLHGVLADLGSLDAVRRLARDVEREFDRLDLLVNNAGIAGPEERRLSADGYELTFAVNYLAHFLLTLELLPLLRKSAPSRIVNVASIGQSPIDFDDVMLERDYDGFRAYRQSKLAQIMFTFELAARLEADGETGVTVNALHPATLMDTKMVRQSLGRASTTVDEGAEATMRLIAAPELEDVTGCYFDGVEEATANDQAYDAQARRRLWELSEDLCRRLETG